jgi:cell wall-associated NlpC family hydrolase
LVPHTRTEKHARRVRLAFGSGLATLALLASAVPVAQAGSGGTGVTPKPVAGKKAKIVNGLAVPPKSAPRRVVEVIQAANRIAKGHPYCLGGGHASFHSSCYDCSGSVSYALHGGGMLQSPVPSSGFYSWGRHGKGRWITVYANGGHAFMTIAGLRFDTSDTRGQGPGWAKGMGYETPSAFKKRHRGAF